MGRQSASGFARCLVWRRSRSRCGCHSVSNGWRAPVFRRTDNPGRATTRPIFLGVSPAYFSTMRIGLVAGRDFRIGDTPPTRDGQQPVAGVGIVNEAFARASTSTDGSPIGRQVLGQDKSDLRIEMWRRPWRSWPGSRRRRIRSPRTDAADGVRAERGEKPGGDGRPHDGRSGRTRPDTSPQVDQARADFP